MQYFVQLLIVRAEHIEVPPIRQYNGMYPMIDVVERQAKGHCFYGTETSGQRLPLVDNMMVLAKDQIEIGKAWLILSL